MRPKDTKLRNYETVEQWNDGPTNGPIVQLTNGTIEQRAMKLCTDRGTTEISAKRPQPQSSVRSAIRIQPWTPYPTSTARFQQATARHCLVVDRTECGRFQPRDCSPWLSLVVLGSPPITVACCVLQLEAVFSILCRSGAYG